MLNILFFARFREELGSDGLQLPFSESLADLDALQEHLCQTGGEQWRAVLEQPNVIRAVNQQVAQANLALTDGDEIAFFPPVTGG